MGTLESQLAQALQPGMVIPDAIRELYNWIERSGFFVDHDDGRRVGGLYPDDFHRETWSEDERPGGTLIAFFAGPRDALKYWFGHDRAEVLSRLCVFAQCGSDGSMAAFWLDDSGRQFIVHLGSGSGSLLTCVLAEHAVDFLRLLAIGYDEICWDEHFSCPPSYAERQSGCVVHPNVRFQDWVRRTFAVGIPETASEIVTHPAHMDEDASADLFHQWVLRNGA